MTGPVSLDGTRTSHRWNALPGSFDTVNARAVYPSANEFGIPDLPAAGILPARLVSYRDRNDSPRPGDCVHHFLDDYRFEVVWTRPVRPLSRLQRVGLALTPDFSMWTGMPPVVQMWQVYRSRWCGAWWAGHGIGVIPTVSWSTPDSYRYAFAGIAACSVVAVSAVGVLRDREALKLFASGYEAMLAAVQPSAVLCYGRMPAGLGGDLVTEYPTRWNERKETPMGGRGSAGGAAKAAAGSETKSTGDRVMSAVEAAAKASTGFYKGDSVPVADARDEAARAGISGADFDKALMDLHDAGKVHVTSSNASRLLTDRQREGGIRFGGKNNTVIQIPRA